MVGRPQLTERERKRGKEREKERRGGKRGRDGSL